MARPTSSPWPRPWRSGDQRLMQKAGIEAEVARLRRLHAAHFDDQHAIAQNVRNAEAAIRSASTRIAQIEEDLRVRVNTRGDAFAMVVGKKPHTERKVAGASLLSKLRLTEKALGGGHVDDGPDRRLRPAGTG